MASYGKEIYNHQDLHPGMGHRADAIKSEFKNDLAARNIPGLKISEDSIGGFTSSRNYLIIQKNVGTGSTAAVALRIEAFGSDLAVEKIHYESSMIGVGTNIGRIYLALAFIGAGILTLVLAGAGIILIIIGIFLWPREIKSSFSGGQRQDSIFLYDAVTLSLDNAVKKTQLQTISKPLWQSNSPPVLPQNSTQNNPQSTTNNNVSTIEDFFKKP